MPDPLRRRPFLALLASASLAGCSALGTSEDCAFERTSVGGWPLPDRDPQNSRAAPAEAAPALADAAPVWRTEFRRHLGPTVASGGDIYVAARRADTDATQSEEPPPAVFAVDAATGERQWRHDVGYEADPGQASLRLPLAVDDDHVYAVQRTFGESVPNRLVTIDAATGERAWVHEGLRAEAPHVGAGAAFVRTDAAVTAVEPATGSVCRRFHVQGPLDRLLGGRTPQVRPALVGDRLFVGSVLAPGGDADAWRYWLSGVDLRTGEVAWTSDRVVTEEYVPPAVTADAERVYLPAANRLTAFGHDGERRWRTTVAGTDRERRRRPPIASVATDGDRLFLAVVATDETGGVYARDAETGAARWHRSDLHGHPLVAGDVVYARRNVEVGEDEYASVLHALDAETGETVGTRRFDAVLDGPPRPVGGRLYVRAASFGANPDEGRPTFRLGALA